MIYVIVECYESTTLPVFSTASVDRAAKKLVELSLARPSGTDYEAWCLKPGVPTQNIIYCPPYFTGIEAFNAQERQLLDATARCILTLTQEQRSSLFRTWGQRYPEWITQYAKFNFPRSEPVP
jgi:hypothetical protein